MRPDPKTFPYDRYFQKGELIPAIVQEASTGQVLMLAYMNRESLKKTLETGYTWFWSRSRQELWNKRRDFRPRAEGPLDLRGLRRRHAACNSRADGRGVPYGFAQLLL